MLFLPLWISVNASAFAPPTDFPALYDAVALHGEVSVIVDLDLTWTSEARLSALERASQRAAISAVQTLLLADLAGSQLGDVSRFVSIRAISFTTDISGLIALQNSPWARRVHLDGELRPSLDQSIPYVRADEVHARHFGGEGQVIAVLDTGVSGIEFDLAGHVVAEACFSTDNLLYDTFCPDGGEEEYGSGSAAPCGQAGCDHGTHVAAIAAGEEGVAPDAGVFAVQVFSAKAGEDDRAVLWSDLELALEHVWEMRDSFPFVAVNMSLGDDNEHSYYCDEKNNGMTDLFKQLTDQGISVVVAAGNDAFTDGVSFPACISTAITVGAISDADGQVASFSNRGPLVDIYAPGVGIHAAVPPGGSPVKSGTSMSTPHVSGAIAALKTALPGRSPTTIAEMLLAQPPTVVVGGVARPSLDVLGPLLDDDRLTHGGRDYNADGREDVAVGVPAEGIGNAASAGGVHVILGGPGFLDPGGDRAFGQNQPEVPGVAEAFDGFGSALGSGDLDGDGFDDLVVGVPFEDSGTISNAGGLTVLFGDVGGPTGLSTAWYEQSSLAPFDAVERDDHFGEALAVADFDGDGLADLAVSAPGETLGGHPGAGAVHVVPGPLIMPVPPVDSPLMLSRGAGEVSGSPQDFDGFGAVLATGDFDADGAAELVIGAPLAKEQGIVQAGAVFVWRWPSVLFTDTITLNQASFGAQISRGDSFGKALAVGDFDADGFDDLAIGVPGEDAGAITNPGAVWLLFGGPLGLSTTTAMSVDERSAGMEWTPQAQEQLGSALAFGDVNADGYDDLIIGVPGEVHSAGKSAVFILPGDPLRRYRSSWRILPGGVFGSPQGANGFGRSLAVGEHSGDRADDVIIGAYNASVNNVNGAGAFGVAPGVPGLPVVEPGLAAVGIPGPGSSWWHEDANGVSGTSEAGDQFGRALR